MIRRNFLTALAAGAALGAGMGSKRLNRSGGDRAPTIRYGRSGKRGALPSWSFPGRVIDRPQGMASHSEGQGYGMVLAAEIADGRRPFGRMMDWSEANLAIRPDNLLAWRWQPDVPGRVADPNNASDGDLF